MKPQIVTTLFAITFWAISTAAPAYAQVNQKEELKNEGAGLYTDASVGNQVSTFTINPMMVSCGVGTADLGGFIGPFEMLMFSINKHSYIVNPPNKTITANGEMRSITRAGGIVVEDTIHDFIAIAQDNQPSRPQPNATDTFEVHFMTPFWTAANPLCTKSTIVVGGCKFGGKVFLGDVSVAPF
jgi:hypothetical protein